MKKISQIVLCFSLLIMSCGEQKSSEAQLSIYGGRSVAHEARRDAVALTDEEGVFCSATALSPTLVITAAHCLVERSSDEIRVYVGNGEAKGLQRGQYEVERLAINPSYDPENSFKGFDAGYLLLKEPLSLPSEAFTTILTDKDEMKELLRGGSDSYLVGFGWDKKNVIGVKLETKAKVRKREATEVFLGGQGRDACQGDSGGPAYGLLKNGEWRVYGITSGGDNCGQGGFWGLMSANICWVLKDSLVTDVKIARSFCSNS